MAIDGLGWIPFLGRLAEARTGAEAASRQLREAGFRFTQSVFREVYRAQQLRVQYGPLLTNLPDRIPIPLSLITPTPGRFIQPYRYVFSFTGTDTRTGERVRQHASIASDEVLSKAQALAQVARAHAVRQGENYLGIDVDEVTLEQVQIAHGAEAEVL